MTTDEIKAYLQAMAGMTIPDSGLTLLTLLQPMIEAAVEERLGFSVAQASYTEFYPVGETNRYTQDEPNIMSFEKTPSGQVIGASRWSREQRYIQLANIPVRSITSVYENYAAWNGGTADGDWPSNTLLPASAYRLDLESSGFCWTGQLIKNYGVWPGVQRSVKVTYTAGFSAGEIAAKYSPIKMAVLTALQDAYIDIVSKSATGGLGGIPASVGIEDFSVSFNTLASQTNGMSGMVALSPKASAMLMPYIRMRKYFGIL